MFWCRRDVRGHIVYNRLFSLVPQTFNKQFTNIKTNVKNNTVQYQAKSFVFIAFTTFTTLYIFYYLINYT